MSAVIEIIQAGPSATVGVVAGIGPQGIQGPPGATDFTQLQNVPSTFPPSAHTHTASAITDFNSAAASAAPVQSVAGRTGAVSLAVTDVANAVADTDPRLSDSRNPLAHSHTLSDITDAGTAAAAATTDFATSAQGLFADSAVQPGDLATIATSGSYSDLANVPSTFTPSAHTHIAADVTDFTSAASTAAPVQSVAGRTGAVTLSVSDVANAVSDTDARLSDARTPLSHTHTAAAITDFNTAASAAAPVQSVAGKVGAVALVKADVGLGNVDNTSDLNKPIGTATQTALDGKAALSHSHGIADVTSLQTALDGKAAASHTHPISEVTNLQTTLDGKAASSHSHAIADVTGLQTALDGKQASGSYATLVGGLVPSTQLPSYVDDVVEAANLASLPVSGETGKIYVTLNTNKTYRWSGSAYVEISASPGSTDAVPEGSSNLYFTTQRAANAAPVQSVAGRTGAVTLAVADVANAVADTDARLSDARSPLAHTHALSDITDAGTAAASNTTDFATSAQGLLADSAVQPGDLAAVATTGSYTDLSNVPSTFAPSSHTHSISDVTNLQTTLDGKAAASHTHSISDVTNLQTTLDGKAAASHTHTASAITDFNSAAASAAPVQSVAGRTGAVTLAVADVSGAVASNDSRLTDARTPTAHKSTHATGGTDALSPADIGAAPASHTHTPSEVGLGNVANVAQVTAVTGTAPIVSSGGTTPAISINAATTAAAGSMSAADKLKLDGIAAGAEVNVNADWNAGSGDAQILNKPTLGGAAALNVGTTIGTVAAGDDTRFADASALTSGTLADARLGSNVSRVMHGIAVGFVLN